MKDHKDHLGDRMKKYESVSQYSLIQRTPIIIRLDGRAFHTWTSGGFKKPFDERVLTEFQRTTQELMSTIQGAKIAFSQSDEISIFLHAYNLFESQMWFDGNIQKITSVAASLTTGIFNKYFQDFKAPASFDCRVFNIPREEVSNYFLWRIKDAHRNIVLATARYFMGHKAIQEKTIAQLLEMMTLLEKDTTDQYKKKYPLIIKADDGKLLNVDVANNFTKGRAIIDEIVNYQEEK